MLTHWVTAQECVGMSCFPKHEVSIRRNLARLIVKETGLSFRQWRQQLQLIMALQGLVKGDTVQKVAHTLGYDSTTAFITMFKKGLGQTPGRYIAGLTTVSPQSAKPDPRQ